MKRKATQSNADRPLFERRYALDQVPGSGLTDRIEATIGEREEIGRALGIEAPASLAFAFELKPLARGRFRLTGVVEGEATQTCVVTLEPVVQHVREAVDTELWPIEQLEPAQAQAHGTEVEVAVDAPEPYSGGSVDIGQFAYEVFVSALDPYPRKPGAQFVWQQDSEAEGEGPFAVLKALRRS